MVAPDPVWYAIGDGGGKWGGGTLRQVGNSGCLHARSVVEFNRHPVSGGDVPMPSGSWSRIGFAAFLAAALAAQQPTAPKFEVVSIRPVPPNTAPVLRDIDFTPVLPGGQFIDSRTNLLFMIAFAYKVENLSIQLVGLPNWAKDRSFAVAAKPAQGFPALPRAENYEQVRLMMRAMLEDRFHLQ